MRKFVRIPLAMALVVALLASCVGLASAEVKVGAGETLSMMLPQGLYESNYSGVFTNELFDAFEAETGIKIDLQISPEMYEVMKVKLATGDAPDMWIQNTPVDVPQFDATNNCVILDDQPWVARLVRDDQFHQWTDGHIYAFPFKSSSWYPGVYYNKDILAGAGITDPAPKTMEEFWALLDKVKAASLDITTLIMANSDAGYAQYFVTICGGLAMQDEAVWEKLYTNQMKYAQSEELIQVMYDFQRLVDNYANKDHISMTRDTAFANMATGKAAFIISDENVAQDLLLRNPDLKLGSFIIPYGDQDLGVSGVFSEGIWVNRQSPRAELCLQYIEWLSQPENIGRWFAERPGSPSLKDVDGGAEYPEAVKNIVDHYILAGKAVSELNAHMTDTKPLFDTYLIRLYQEVLMKEITPEEMWARWDDTVADYMQSIENPNWAE